MTDRESRWAECMRAGLTGDRAAYEEFLRGVTPVLRASISRRMAVSGRSTAETEDVVQEILLAVHLKRHTWRTEDALGPWLWTIARNKLIDHMRRRGRRIEVPIEDFEEVLPAAEERPGTDAADVERHLALLPERQRAILQAIAVEGASASEVALRMEMTPGAVRVALHRGFAALAAKLRGGD